LKLKEYLEKRRRIYDHFVGVYEIVDNSDEITRFEEMYNEWNIKVGKIETK